MWKELDADDSGLLSGEERREALTKWKARYDTTEAIWKKATGTGYRRHPTARHKNTGAGDTEETKAELRALAVQTTPEPPPGVPAHAFATKWKGSYLHSVRYTAARPGRRRRKTCWRARGT